MDFRKNFLIPQVVVITKFRKFSKNFLVKDTHWETAPSKKILGGINELN